MNCIVYKITNIKNGKIYIGYTSRSLIARWKSHVSAAMGGSKLRLHCAIRKYGAESFIQEILVKNLILEDAKQLEVEKIKEYNSYFFSHGYNGTLGGTGGNMLERLDPKQLDNWKNEQKVRSAGANNGNSKNITNEEIVDLGKKIYQETGKFPTIRLLRQRDSRVPKSFTKYRFGGYRGYINTMVDILGILDYNPNTCHQETKEKISKTLRQKNGNKNNNKN